MPGELGWARPALLLQVSVFLTPVACPYRRAKRPRLESRRVASSNTLKIVVLPLLEIPVMLACVCPQFSAVLSHLAITIILI